MFYKGFVLHHSRCPSINGKGYDFWIGADGTVHTAPLLTDPDYIHICLDGDFSGKDGIQPPQTDRKEQLFAAGQLILELSRRYQITPLIIETHSNSCPGAFFPWNELVIYPSDGYH